MLSGDRSTFRDFADDQATSRFLPLRDLYICFCFVISCLLLCFSLHFWFQWFSLFTEWTLLLLNAPISLYPSLGCSIMFFTSSYCMYETIYQIMYFTFMGSRLNDVAIIKAFFNSDLNDLAFGVSSSVDKKIDTVWLDFTWRASTTNGQDLKLNKLLNSKTRKKKN